MKTQVEIDDELLANAMKLGRHRTKRGAVESALQHYVRWRARQELLALRGKVRWIGDLDRTRKNRFSRAKSSAPRSGSTC